MKIELLISLCLCVTFSLFFIIYRCSHREKTALLLKTISSVLFVLLGVYSFYLNSTHLVNILIICGLIFGLLGDIFLDLKVIYHNDKDFYLACGFLFFALGHLFYLSYFLSFYLSHIYIVISLIFSIIAIVGSIFIFKKWRFSLENMLIQTLIYELVLGFVFMYCMLISIFKGFNILFSIAMPIFVISDMILCVMYYKDQEDNKVLCFLNHLLYYAAQILIAISIYFI